MKGLPLTRSTVAVTLPLSYLAWQRAMLFWALFGWCTSFTSSHVAVMVPLNKLQGKGVG